MLKKITVSLLLASSMMYAKSSSVDKGFTYYKYIIKPIILVNGSDFTAYHTAQQWKSLFENEAKGFKKKYGSMNSDFESFVQSSKFVKIAPHLEAFLMYYAKDSGYSPHCGNEEID